MKIQLGNKNLCEIEKTDLFDLLFFLKIFQNETKCFGTVFNEYGNHKITHIHNNSTAVLFKAEYLNVETNVIIYVRGIMDIKNFYININKKNSKDENESETNFTFNINVFNFLIEKGFNLPFSTYKIEK